MSDAPPTLRTPRLTLRPLDPADAAAIADGVGNWDVVRWLSVVPHPYGPSDAETFIAGKRRAAAPVWAVEAARGCVGVIGVENELGYWLARPVWGLGYGLEAAVAVVDHWFADPAHEALTSGYFRDNLRSAKVLRALGFAATGVRKVHSVALSQYVDSVGMRLTREVWLTRQAMTIATERLKIRPLALDDAPALVPFAQAAITRHTCTVTPGWDAAAARDWIADRLWQGYGSGSFAVLRDRRIIGVVGAHGAPLQASWMFLPEHGRQGLATEALSAFLPAILATSTRAKIEAEIFEDNAPSRALAAKLGFTPLRRGLARSRGRLEPAPAITYALARKDAHA